MHVACVVEVIVVVVVAVVVVALVLVVFVVVPFSSDVVVVALVVVAVVLVVLVVVEGVVEVVVVVLVVDVVDAVVLERLLLTVVVELMDVVDVVVELQTGSGLCLASRSLSNWALQRSPLSLAEIAVTRSAPFSIARSNFPLDGSMRPTPVARSQTGWTRSSETPSPPRHKLLRQEKQPEKKGLTRGLSKNLALVDTICFKKTA